METQKNKTTVFRKPADGIAQASIFLHEKKNISDYEISKQKKLLTAAAFYFSAYFTLDSAALKNFI